MKMTTAQIGRAGEILLQEPFGSMLWKGQDDNCMLFRATGT